MAPRSRRTPITPHPHHRPVFDDPWPEEPPDPYDGLGDPEVRFDLDIPDDADVPRELMRAFWGLVAVFNVGLFATAVGALLIGVAGRVELGGVILVIGLVSLGYGLVRFREYRGRRLGLGDPANDR